MDTLKPPKLKQGDVVGVCSPSGTIAHKEELFNTACQNFERATGLQVRVTPNARRHHYYSAGTPAERLDDFHALVRDGDIAAIIFSAGGDTAIDLVDQLDYELIRANPKIIAGISDATTLLSAITAQTGLITFLGLELLDFAKHAKPYELKYLKRAWFEGAIGAIETNPDWRDLSNTHTTYTQWQTIRPGVAEGRLVGGNSESFIQLLDTDYALDVSDSVLFLETYKLPKKQIHKALMQLKLHGVFDGLSGLIIGYCLESDNPGVVGNEQSLAELVLETVADYDFPVMHVGEIGHYVENALQPIGALAHMDAAKLELEIIESVAV